MTDLIRRITLARTPKNKFDEFKSGDTVSVSVAGDSIVANQVTTSITNQNNSFLVSLFPNPSHDLVKIQSSKNNMKKI